MDFFERAHVVKRDTAKKEGRSEESVKKQLKQMLHGYKRSDNKIIKEAGNGKKEYDDFVGGFDDSTSVSGFSDLNLTISSTEGDKTQEARTDDSFQLDKIRETKSNSSVSNEELQESLGVDIDSIDNEEIHSLSEDTQDNPNISSSDSQTIPFSDTSSELASSDSEFDRDGDLAFKILTRLGKKETKSNKERKITIDKSVNDNNIIDVPIKIVASNIDIKKSDIITSNISQQADDNTKSDCDSFSQDSSMTSSPYISITAENMPDQSLSEILGDYRYPTMKNLPSDNHNVNHSNLFSTNSVDTAEIHVEEEIDSLIPELGEDPTIEDLEMDTEVDLSLQQPNDDSTTVFDDTMQSEGFTDTQDSVQSVELDNINPVNIYQGKNMYIFILKHPSKIYIHGKVKIKALGGTIEVFGYTLKDDFCDLYAPNYNCAQCIKTVESQNIYYGLFGKLTSSGLSVKDAEEIVTTIDEYDGIFSLSALSSCKIDFVENNFKTIDLFSKQNKYIENCFRQASEHLGCTLYSMPPFKCYVVNSIWEQVINCGKDKESRTIVCGGKGSGKSTFLRYYVNQLLGSGPVLVIDLDPGQAEFTVPGHVSVTVVTKPLLGPSFTHLVSPDLMLNIGMISTMDNPMRYANAVAEIIAHCSSNVKYKTMPWIVNTMGMTNNMGLKFITLIIMHVQPTFVLQIDSKHLKARYEAELHPVMVKSIFNHFKRGSLFRNVLNSDLNYQFLKCSYRDNDGKNTSLAARDERYLNFLAYFGELLNVHSGPGLLGIVPYEVRLQDLNIGINVNIPKEAVTKVINGRIIALCQLTTLDKGKVFVLGDNAVRCLGHGLVRGVDFEKGILYVVTPAPVDTLSLVNTLVYADWVPELKGEERLLPVGTAVPYRVASVHKQKHLMVSPRRRFNPLQLLKMSRSS